MSVQFDVFSDILNMIRLSGTVYFRLQFGRDWAMEVPSSPYKMFYLVERGECWLDGDFTDAPICLQAGDMLTFPHGDYHCLSTTREHILPLPYTTILEAQQMGQLPDTHEPCATLVWGDTLSSRKIFCIHF